MQTSNIQVLPARQVVVYTYIYYGQCRTMPIVIHISCYINILNVKCFQAVRLMTKTNSLPKPRYASLKKIYQPSTGDIIDKGLILWFPGLLTISLLQYDSQ